MQFSMLAGHASWLKGITALLVPKMKAQENTRQENNMRFFSLCREQVDCDEVIVFFHCSLLCRLFMLVLAAMYMSIQLTDSSPTDGLRVCGHDTCINLGYT